MKYKGMIIGFYMYNHDKFVVSTGDDVLSFYTLKEAKNFIDEHVE